ncbi:uncharacterized protein LOC115076011 [Rhinatrema bivittatum]|uniref:uncharacterized protein LOC115076011 n=1 Tax=Rhinatrema bivittatum TaxID=194408 RepID=UPI0011274F54|nr:uncharacterized protein LOC115076011 [Rhinatrema bivittatum]
MSGMVPGSSGGEVGACAPAHAARVGREEIICHHSNKVGEMNSRDSGWRAGASMRKDAVAGAFFVAGLDEEKSPSTSRKEAWREKTPGRISNQERRRSECHGSSAGESVSGSLPKAAEELFGYGVSKDVPGSWAIPMYTGRREER